MDNDCDWVLHQSLFAINYVGELKYIKDENNEAADAIFRLGLNYVEVWTQLFINIRLQEYTASVTNMLTCSYLSEDKNTICFFLHEPITGR